jgi:hypothetical protein
MVHCLVRHCLVRHRRIRSGPLGEADSISVGRAEFGNPALL